MNAAIIRVQITFEPVRTVTGFFSKGADPHFVLKSFLFSSLHQQSELRQLVVQRIHLVLDIGHTVIRRRQKLHRLRTCLGEGLDVFWVGLLKGKAFNPVVPNLFLQLF